ncbi:hypothetical protein EC2726800_5325 [Escherichia coli 2726800]|nr:hypothetical protein EC2747800_5033 [Escherichia coli 2747800]EMX69811.1 hypothetical protein EC2726800_5325 [Escherichia coli 2726800]ENB05720.1 hypothetical protein EC2866350_3327 [Escherichia coli 2866350]
MDKYSDFVRLGGFHSTMGKLSAHSMFIFESNIPVLFINK